MTMSVTLDMAQLGVGVTCQRTPPFTGGVDCSSDCRQAVRPTLQEEGEGIVEQWRGDGQ